MSTSYILTEGGRGGARKGGVGADGEEAEKREEGEGGEAVEKGFDECHCLNSFTVSNLTFRSANEGRDGEEEEEDGVEEVVVEGAEEEEGKETGGTEVEGGEKTDWSSNVCFCVHSKTCSAVVGATKRWTACKHSSNPLYLSEEDKGVEEEDEDEEASNVLTIAAAIGGDEGGGEVIDCSGLTAWAVIASITGSSSSRPTASTIPNQVSKRAIRIDG